MLGKSEGPGLIMASSQNHAARNLTLHFNTKEEIFRLPVANGEKSEFFSILVEIALANIEFLLKQKIHDA